MPFPDNSQPDGAKRNGARHTEAVATLPRFVVQLHDATALHFDFRLQAGGVLRSWAVPKGPSLDPGIRRLAVPVEDHDLAAGDFEGVHEGQSRGSGAVIIRDEGARPGSDIVTEQPASVRSGSTWQELRREPQVGHPWGQAGVAQPDGR